MRTETREIYEIAELSGGAREKAIQNARMAGWGECGWGEDYGGSLEHGAELLGMTKTRNAYILSEALNHADLTGVRAYKWIVNNIPETMNPEFAPTGFCADWDFYKPIREFCARPAYGPTLADVFFWCVQSLESAWEAEVDYCYLDGQIVDALEANCVEFDEHGNIV